MKIPKKISVLYMIFIFDLAGMTYVYIILGFSGSDVLLSSAGHGFNPFGITKQAVFM